MSSKRIVLCNERFLARFGVDRILVLLARRLQGEGSEVALSCLRSDPQALEGAKLSVDEVTLEDGLNFIEADVSASQQVLERMIADGPPDVVVIGGWPFFSLGALAASRGIRSIFIDAGAVPHDGMPEAALPIQRELRRLREVCLSAIDEVLPISAFIADSQTVPDRGALQGVETVLLGADHLDGLQEVALNTEEQLFIDRMDEEAAKGIRQILLLGRFEEHGYKNSPEAFNILRRVQKEVPDVRLLVLAGSESIDVPGDLKSKVVFLPTISDACLAEISKRSALGLSMSLWEGFNLPLAEMQWFDRPALVFNVGAHPEVAADPWLLCETSEEMGRKAVRLLQDESGLRLALAESMDRFRARFRWNGTLSRWVATILQDPSASPAVPPGKLRRLVLVDVTNSSRDPANSGVIRVTRRLSRELSARPELEVWFVAWDPARDGGRGGFRLLGQTERQFLASNGGPTDVKGVAFERLISSAEELLSTAGHVSTASPIFLFPEIALDGSAFARNEWASRQGCRIANVFYDMIPIYQSEYVDHTVRGAFPDYLRSISKADAVWSISGFSQSEFERYANEQSLAIPQRCEALLLPGQFSDRSRVKGQSEQDLSGTSVNILCVATIEPRKNHIALLDAFNKLRDIAPELSVHLHLVGNSYVNADSLTARVLDAASNDDQITWHKILPDATLAELYESASFTVYPSLTEGFGLPIMESLWIGRPCICHNSGVMAELAAGGGCLTVDMTSALALAQSMKKLAEDPALRAKLAQEAQARAISTWGDYAEEITRRICDL